MGLVPAIPPPPPPPPMGLDVFCGFSEKKVPSVFGRRQKRATGAGMCGGFST